MCLRTVLAKLTDVVGKEMFVVRSGENYKRALAEGDDSKLKSKQKLSLRPEGTAGVVRAVVQHNLVEQGAAPAKLFYAGPMFRAERPQKGRLRQFHQIGAECLGSTEPTADAEMIIMLMRFFEKMGVPMGKTQPAYQFHGQMTTAVLHIASRCVSSFGPRRRDV